MRNVLLLTLVVSLAVLAGCGSGQATQKTERKDPKLQYVDTDTGRWLVHDINRPEPKVVTLEGPYNIPSDATVLFTGEEGEDLSEWTDRNGKEAKWVVRDGYMESVKGSGPIKSKKEFGSCQLHVEFATPTPVKGSGQGRGNSGVFLMGEYEVQVLDSYENRTYVDGQCGALYGRAVPLVNARRKPGEWQSYDIVFHRPTFKDGKVCRKAKFPSIFHNGVLIHDDVELDGGTQWRGPHAISDYRVHGDKGPIMLQDHGNPVQFRNIWIRELAD